MSLCSRLPMPIFSYSGSITSAQILLSCRSAIAKPAILLSFSHTHPFPRLSIYVLQSSSVTNRGLDRIFSFYSMSYYLHLCNIFFLCFSKNKYHLFSFYLFSNT